MESKIALVTGASRGIGQAIALQLAKAGCQVVGTATSDSGADKISQYFKENNLKGCGKKLNIADKDNVEAVLAEIKKEIGAPSILVNNAGITRDNLMLRMKDDEWLDVINTNLNGTFYVIKNCLRDMMKARWGRIINLSSIVGEGGNPGQANYSASKSGIDGLTRSLGKEVASRNITVNAIAPGFIQTDMTNVLTDEQKTGILGAVPAGRIGDPAEIASVVEFLASDAASYVTAQVLHVNGGMY